MRYPLLEVTALFLRLGVTAFGGPAAHVALIERECVRRRQWLTHEEFLDVLGIANLIPGPTSTELAIHVGARRAGWPGLVAAGTAFILPSALMVGVLAALYVRGAELPAVRGVLAAVQPVVLVVVIEALIPLARSALQTVPRIAVGAAAAAAALAGMAEILVLLLAGLVHAAGAGRMFAAAILVALTPVAVAAAATPAGAPDLFVYFARIGAFLFGSGYVLLPVLEGDLVGRLGWLTERQLLDAVAAGQATPGPVFTTATFIGYLLGGGWGAVAATVGIFLPAFIGSALAWRFDQRLRRSTTARAFLAGVNAAAVALIALVVVTMARAALTGLAPLLVFAGAALLVFGARVNPAIVLAAAAVGGGVWSAVRP